jgi:hypothetical protein
MTLYGVMGTRRVLSGAYTIGTTHSTDRTGRTEEVFVVVRDAKLPKSQSDDEDLSTNSSPRALGTIRRHWR